MARRRKKRLHHHVRDYFLPHRGNRYKPGVFALGSVTLIVACVLLLFVVYLLGTKLSPKGGYFASVLPAALTAYTNADRVANSLDTLTPDPLLAEAAQKKADDMAAKGYFSHISPDGKTPWYWLDQMGYKYSYAGENLAVDFVDSKDVEDAWMQSPAHHANIVKPNYTKIGIGVAQGMYQGKETTFVVELFAAAPEATPPAPEKATVAPAASPTKAADSRVLAAEKTTPAPAPAPAAPAPSIVTEVAASPSHAIAYVLAIVLILVLGLLALAVAIHLHMRTRSLEMMSGGFVLASVLVGCLYFTAQNSTVILPSDGQSASVVSAL